MVVSKEAKIPWTKIVFVFIFSLLIAFVLSPMGLRDIHADIGCAYGILTIPFSGRFC